MLPNAKKYLELATKADAVNSDAWIMLAIVLVSEAASARAEGVLSEKRQKLGSRSKVSLINSSKTQMIHANLPAALDALQRAAKILSNSKKKVPSWIWNNIGVLRFNVVVWKSRRAARGCRDR